MTKCERDDCQERVFPAMMTCEANHRQTKAALVPPEMAIQAAMFDLQMRLRDKEKELEPDTLAYLKAHLEGLHAAAQVVREHRAIVKALETLRDVVD